VDDEEGLRARKKRETRRLLSEVATRLFAERGFDRVTIAEVAQAANVSEKTVFNYFATKEDLVVDGRREVDADLLRMLRERLPSESGLDAARKHTLAVAERMTALPAWRRAAFRKLVQHAPSVHARMRQLSIEQERELVALLSEGTPPGDVTPQLVAGVLGILGQLAYRSVTDGERDHDAIVRSIDAAYERVAKGLGDFGVKKRRR